MDRLKAVLKAVFCLPPIMTVLLALLGYGFVIFVFAHDVQNPFLRYASYLASAYALVITLTGLPYLSRCLKKAKSEFDESILMRKFRSTAFGEKYLTDIHFRNRISLSTGLMINLAYIVMKLSAGIYYSSAWFIALAVYYILLAVMRLFLIRYMSENDRDKAFRRYRLCGFILLIMNQALAGIVIFIVHQNRGFQYPGILIYAMALYAFYAMITAAVNVVRTRRHNSPVLSAAKAVNLVAALVSILSLTTAMLTQFGGDDDPAFRRTMTGAVGGGVCTIVIGMAVFMIYRANKELKKE